MADENEFGTDKSDGNETNLSNSSALKRSTGAGYLTSGGVKKGDGNTKKSVKAARVSDYLIPDAKKNFNHLRYAFIQAPLFQHFDPEWHIQIETDVLSYTIGRVLSQLILNDLG